MTSSDAPELIILPSLEAAPGPNGGLILTKKFLSGVAHYAKYWPGRVTTLVREEASRTSDMDHIEIFPETYPLALERRPTDPHAEAARLSRAAVILAFLSPEEARLAALCRRLRVLLVYSSEYSRRTEFQIIRATTPSRLRRLRKYVWTWNAERKRLAALRLAAGVQCSGTPTHEIYSRVNASALLFFDNRVPAERVLSEVELETKIARLLESAPLRLVFGGRLIAMKGVLDLPRLASALVERRVRFTLDIVGSGDLKKNLEGEVIERGLSEYVRFRGPLDFDEGWVPLLKTDADLFVCPHPQGDPSSTYPEVMSCGVPIVGYDNDAFRGIVEHSSAGWTIPLGDVEKFAERIDHLARHRAEVAERARRAVRFGLEHSFENTFRARTAHLARAAGLDRGSAPPER